MSQSKNMLDKNLMFQKIMPSSQPKTPVKVPEEARPEPAPVQVPQDSLRSRVFANASEWRAAGRPTMVNITEELVLESLDQTVEKFNCCRCDRCRQDVVALALNQLTPRYVVMTAEAVEKLESEYPKKEVLAALVHAVVKVRGNPRH